MSKNITKEIRKLDVEFYNIAQKMDNELYHEEEEVKNSLESFYITSTSAPQVGDVVVKTTADSFNFDGSTGNFCQEPVDLFKVYGEVIAKDYSNFQQGKCNNGGKYGFVSIKVLMVE